MEAHYQCTSQANSAADLQQAASAMLRESRGCGSALTKRIAAAGSHGKWCSNVARDISRALNFPLVLCLHVSIVDRSLLFWVNNHKMLCIWCRHTMSHHEHPEHHDLELNSKDEKCYPTMTKLWRPFCWTPALQVQSLLGGSGDLVTGYFRDL